MEKISRSRKSAFSLIELSIVLIIIGLLIAGVTGGASLIRSSELRSVVGEARGYAVAVNAFYSQYNALPGDYSTSLAGAKIGDGNGKIEYVSTATASTTATPSESANAWILLKTIGAIDTLTSTPTLVEATITSGAPVTFGTNAPSSKIKSSGWSFDYRNNATAPFSYEASSQNVVVLTGAVTYSSAATSSNTIVNGTNVATAAIYATDALSIDTKVDDANPGTGTVRGLNPATATFPTASSTTSTSTCYYGTAATTSTYAYNSADTAKSCGLTYQVDVTTN